MNNFISKARFFTLGTAIAFLPFSIRFCHLSLLIFMIVCLCQGNFGERWKTILRNPLTWLLPAFFLLHVIGIIYSNNILNAWTNVDKKLAFFLAPLIIASAIPFSRSEIRKLSWIFVGACVLGTMICLVNAVLIEKGNGWNLGPVEPYLELHSGASNWWPYFSYIHLSSGIGMHPTYLSLYLLICILIVLRTVNNGWLSLTLIVYMLIFIVMLSSRVVVFISALTLIGFVPKGKLVIAGVIIVALLINPVALYRNAQEYTTSNFSLPPAAMSDNPISIRMSLLWLSAKAIEETNPVIGTGTGDVNDTIGELQDRYNTHNVLNTSDPHNQYLHTYIGLGIIGLMLLAAVFIIPLLMIYRQREFFICLGVIAFMAVCATESALELQKGIVLFSLFVGLTGNQLREWRFTTQHLNYA